MSAPSARNTTYEEALEHVASEMQVWVVGVVPATGISAAPVARAVVQSYQVAGEVDLHATDARPPVRDEPAAVSRQSSNKAVGGQQGLAPAPVPPNRRDEACTAEVVDPLRGSPRSRTS